MTPPQISPRENGPFQKNYGPLFPVPKIMGIQRTTQTNSDRVLRNGGNTQSLANTQVNLNLRYPSSPTDPLRVIQAALGNEETPSMHGQVQRYSDGSMGPSPRLWNCLAVVGMTGGSSIWQIHGKKVSTLQEATFAQGHNQKNSTEQYMSGLRLSMDDPNWSLRVPVKEGGFTALEGKKCASNFQTSEDVMAFLQNHELITIDRSKNGETIESQCWLWNGAQFVLLGTWKAQPILNTRVSHKSPGKRKNEPLSKRYDPLWDERMEWSQTD